MGELILIVNHTRKEYIDPNCKIGNLTEDIMRYLIRLLRLQWAECNIQVVGENQQLFFDIINFGKYKLLEYEKE